MNQYKMYINGEWISGEKELPVYDKYTGEVYAQFPDTTAEQVDEAVAAAYKSFKEHPLSASERYQILRRAGELMLEEKESMAELICHEVGRLMGDSLWEVDRTWATMELAAEEARRIAGEIIPTEGMAGQEDKFCYTVRKPIGVVALIMPFNLPLILTINKLAYAIAAGNTVVLKPTQVCPGYAVKLVEILLKAGLPANHIQLVLGRGRIAGEALLKNQTVAFYCFTGSMEGGIHVRNSVGLRRCSMDLGNTTPVIVHKDADVELAAGECAGNGFFNAGQVCFRPQRIYVHKDIYEQFLGICRDFAASRVVGDPTDPATNVGPMISEEDVERVDQWVKEAVAGGATLVIGGEKKTSRVYMPTILTNTTKDMKVVSNEIFGPVIVINAYEDLDDAIAQCNDSPFGLHGGIYTKDINVALKAVDLMEYGGITVNVSPATHVPNMPFGGIKNSGSGGNEGPRYTIEEMTDVKTIIIARKEA